MTVCGLLAHQGGWDEILFVVAPLVVFAGLLMVARRRVDRMEGTEDAGDDEAASSTGPDGPEPR